MSNRYIVFYEEGQKAREWQELDANSPEEAESIVISWGKDISVISIWERVL